MNGRSWLGLAVLLATAGLAAGERPDTGWRDVLQRRVAAFGHRNWIVIADSAYPEQSRAGVETVVTGAGHLEVLQEVLAQLNRAKHVRPVVYLDAELAHVDEDDAPGIGRLRSGLRKALGRRETRSLAHEKLIERLDKAGEKVKVLVLKTDLRLPYTSVFIELDCGYWDDAAEKRLRKAMEKARKNKRAPGLADSPRALLPSPKGLQQPAAGAAAATVIKPGVSPRTPGMPRVMALACGRAWLGRRRGDLALSPRDSLTPGGAERGNAALGRRPRFAGAARRSCRICPAQRRGRMCRGGQGTTPVV